MTTAEDTAPVILSDLWGRKGRSSLLLNIGDGDS